MSFDLKSIKGGTADRPPRIVLLGEEKVGKTTFAAAWPNPVMLPVLGEEGADHIDIAKFPAAGTLAEVTEALTTLAEGEHEFETLIVDSVSALEPIIWQSICQRDKQQSIEAYGYGKGYTLAGVEWRDLLNACDFLRNERGMAVILIGHSKVRTFSDPAGDSYDRYELDLHKGTAADLLRWADAILFARWKALAKKSDKGFGQKESKAIRTERVLCCQTNGAFPAGGRGPYGHLPAELELSYPAYLAALKEAVK